MKPAIAVIDVHRTYKVHTEFHANPLAQKTIILVNGSLATTASFAQTVKYLATQFNVVLFDQPYAGQSRPHNRNDHCMTKEDEAAILLDLIDHYRAQYLMSFSWGGIASMLALSLRPATLEKAVFASFSPILNEPMLDYLSRALVCLSQEDGDQVGHLINTTIGKHLPSLFKRYNHKHTSRLSAHEYRQMNAHVQQVLRMQAHCHLDRLGGIDIPLLFINGELDDYTSRRRPPDGPLHQRLPLRHGQQRRPLYRHGTQGRLAADPERPARLSATQHHQQTLHRPARPARHGRIRRRRGARIAPAERHRATRASFRRRIRV